MRVMAIRDVLGCPMTVALVSTAIISEAPLWELSHCPLSDVSQTTFFSTVGSSVLVHVKKGLKVVSHLLLR